MKLLIPVSVLLFNEGVSLMKGNVVNDIFKNYYGLEPSWAQTYLTMSMSPWLLKFFFGIIIDSKLLPKRKYYMIILGILGTFFQLMASLRPRSANLMFLYLYCYNACAAFIDAAVDSIVVQQARKDPLRGQQDLRSF